MKVEDTLPCLQKPPTLPYLDHMYPIHALASYLFQVLFNNILNRRVHFELGNSRTVLHNAENYSYIHPFDYCILQNACNIWNWNSETWGKIYQKSCINVGAMIDWFCFEGIV
jgi:hypothetical protein